MKHLMHAAVFLISLNCLLLRAQQGGEPASSKVIKVTPSQVTLLAGKSQDPDGKCQDPDHQQKFTATVAPTGTALIWKTDPPVGEIRALSATEACFTAPPALADGAVMPVGTIQLVVTSGADPVRATIDLAPDNHGGGEAARIIAGFAQSAAASTSPVQKAFIDGFFSRPLPWWRKRTDAALGPPLRIWGDLRLDSVPQQINATVGTFDIATEFGGIKVNQLVQTGEFLAGAQYRLFSTPTFRLFDLTGRGRTTVSVIVGGGMVTPLSPQDTKPQIFEKPNPNSSSYPLFASTFPAATGSNYEAIAFVTQDRTRFFRQYFGGFRIETHYFSDALTATTRSQHSLDVMIGQNSSVTGGALQGPVMRFEAFYAVPTGKTAPNFIYLFGTGQFGFGRSIATSPLLLQPSPTSRSVYDPAVYIQTSPQPNRDVYRIGIGMDFVQLYQLIKNAATGPPSGSGPSGTN